MLQVSEQRFDLTGSEWVEWSGGEKICIQGAMVGVENTGGDSWQSNWCQDCVGASAIVPSAVLVASLRHLEASF